MRIILVIVLILVPYRYTRAESAVFDYDDFGPQVLAYKTIGFQWYQWNSVGDCDPNKFDIVKVVVFWDEPLKKIKNKYLVDPKKKKDYRYLSYEKAMEYIEKTIDEIPGSMNLIKTRDKLRLLKSK